MNKNIKILIVEDEVLIAEFINEMLLDEGYQNIELVHDCESAIEKFNLFKPEIILLDINIEGRDSGINLAKAKNEEAKVIYITAQNDEATIKKAIETNPESYLTKPVKKIDVIAAVKLASFKIKNDYVIVRDGIKDVKVLFDEIIYIKSDGNYIDIFLQNKKMTIRKSLDYFLNDLNNPDFVKVHRSYIVNIKKVTSKKSNFIYIDEIEIPISRNLDFYL